MADFGIHQGCGGGLAVWFKDEFFKGVKVLNLACRPAVCVCAHVCVPAYTTCINVEQA